MPIYEYRCAGCGRKASLFFRSIAAAEPNPACPNCAERRLERTVSRVWAHRSSQSVGAYPEPTFEDDGIPFYGPDPFSASSVDDGSLGEGFDDSGSGIGEDSAAMAREARMMAQMMGEPLDAEFDAALRHVERGADPDEVFGELDEAERSRDGSAGDVEQ
jgi:putative FmdB family regulatory protein